MNTQPMPSDEPLPEISGFVIERRLDVAPGRAVWLGRDADGTQVMLMRQPAGVDSAVRRRISHPHLIGWRDETRSATGDRYLVLDFLAGGSLAQLATARGTLDPEEVVTVLTPLAEAVGHLHENGLTAGEIGAGDVLFGEDGRPVLCDLGAPASNGAAEDVAALGAIGWYALTGRTPQPAATRVPLPILTPDAPLELTSLIERCVAETPSQRPALGELALRVYDSCPPAPVRLMPPPDGDPCTNLTQRLRRRGDEAAATEALDALLGTPFAEQAGDGSGRARSGGEDQGRDWASSTTAMPATPATPRSPKAEASRPAINRSSLRRAPAEPVRRGPRRAVLIGALLALTVLGGAGAAAFVFRSPGTPTAAAGSATPAGAKTAAPTGTKTAAATSPAPTTRAATTKATSKAPTTTASPTEIPGASSTNPTAKTSGSPSSNDQGTAAVAALQQLSALRTTAYATGDASALSRIYTADSPAAKTDQTILTGKSFRGITFDLTDPQVKHASGSEVEVSVTSTTGAYDLIVGGTVTAHADRQPPRQATVTLVQTDEGWRIKNVA